MTANMPDISQRMVLRTGEAMNARHIMNSCSRKLSLPTVIAGLSSVLSFIRNTLGKLSTAALDGRCHRRRGGVSSFINKTGPKCMPAVRGDKRSGDRFQGHCRARKSRPTTGAGNSELQEAGD